MRLLTSPVLIAVLDKIDIKFQSFSLCTVLKIQLSMILVKILLKERSLLAKYSALA